MKNINGFFYINHKNFTLNTTFNFNNKKITAIIGKSGSGKTTFLKCISGLIKPKHGYLKIKNITIQNSKNHIFIKTNKRNIGYVFQTPCLFPNMNVIQNIMSGKKNTNRYKINKKKILKILDLEKLTTRKINMLSGGEKQRVSIAQIIIMEPNLILLDEALSSQDINNKNTIINLLKEINNKYKIPIIYVSHDIKKIHYLTKNIIYMNNGKIQNSYQ